MIKDNIKITEGEVINAQKLWGENIVQIGKLYVEKGNYREHAYNFVKKFYAYDITNVLFKPTLACTKQFRNTFDDALSYFIGGDIKEDDGFALKIWDEIRFGDRNLIIMENYVVVMGNYYFKSTNEQIEVKAEYTFGYIKNLNGDLVINLHHSSLPYIKT